MTGSATRYPTQQDIEDADDVLLWIDEAYLRLDPAAFNASTTPFQEIAGMIARELDVDRNGIYCVGSGAMGLSLDPMKVTAGRLKVFDSSSDIDLAVVSAYHFEQAWRDLRTKTQPHLEELHPDLVANLNWQRKRLFDGVILTSKLLPFLSFASEWQGAIERVAERVVKSLDRNVDISLWLYRDYWSIRNYVSVGLTKCKEILRTG